MTTSNGLTVDDVARLESVLAVLERERDRVLVEYQALDLAARAQCATEDWPVALSLLLPAVRAAGAALCKLDVGELRTRADAAATFLDALERVVASADAALSSSERLGEWLAAAERVAPAARAYSPVGTLADDAQQLARDIVEDTRSLAKIGLGVGAVVAVAALLLWSRR